MPIYRGNRVWPTTCTSKLEWEMGMADFTRELSQEYWRPSQPSGGQQHGFHTQGEAFCNVCGTPYAAGARFCHLCGLGRDEDLHAEKTNQLLEWMDIGAIRMQFGLSNVSMVFLLAATIFMLATVLTGLVYNTSTVAEWQAVQAWRVEWLLATVVALLAAMLFKKQS